MGDKVLSWYYKYRQTYQESQLDKLQTLQKKKVEELKKKTGYYATKGLIEKYDIPLGIKVGHGLNGKEDGKLVGTTDTVSSSSPLFFPSP